ncbi:MAG: DinB family protein [Bacteroidia bacterium]|nr:DinB family protein [Bacteroidia bacterium]
MAATNNSDINFWDEIIEESRKYFSNLDERQLNRRSGKESWSIGQCLQHVILMNEKYFPVMDAVISGRYKPDLWARMSPLSKATGKSLAIQLGKDVMKKYKSPRPFLPEKMVYPPEIVKRFTDHIESLKTRLLALRNIPQEKIIIHSPVSFLITFPLSDVPEIIQGHTRRHLNQAIRMLKSLG